jgi:5'-nucleotidase
MRRSTLKWVNLYADAAEEVGRICNAYNATDIDFTVLLTHIGFEEDIKTPNANAFGAFLVYKQQLAVLVLVFVRHIADVPALCSGFNVVIVSVTVLEIPARDVLLTCDADRHVAGQAYQA